MQTTPVEAPYETVYVVEDWYDGPRSGYADYRRKPHFYRSLHLDINNHDDYNPDEDRFELTPASEQAVEWTVASYQLWLKWEEAYHAGTLAPEDDAPVLPEDRVQDQHLRESLERHKIEQDAFAFIVRGRFELGCNRVQWYSLDEAPAVEQM